MDITEVGA